MTCATIGCRNSPRKGRRHCHKCSKRQYRQQHAMLSAYQRLKDGARRRGKLFDLTFEQFEQFAIRTQYMTKRGIYKHSYHIDRIREDRGYTIDNIQVLTNSENIRKSLRYRYNDEERRMEFKVTVSKPSEDEVPF
jgi:cupin superfamily acireductone dioxygenase involved in methionine salvage